MSSSVASRPLLAMFALAALLAASVVIAVLLAPALQQLLRAAGVANPSFAEVAFRSLQVSLIAVTALALVWMKRGRTAAWPGSGWGLRPTPHPIRRALLCFAAGSLALIVVAGALMLLDVREVRYDVRTEASYWLSVVVRALIAALAIAVIEELWFRGGLFSLLQGSGGFVAALVLTTGLYAISHFLDRDAGAAVAGEDWRAALLLLGLGSRHLFDASHLGTLLALAAAGVWLTALRWRHSDIIGCIALHMGFVFVIKVFKKLTYINSEAPLRALAGRYDDTVGWLAFVVLAVGAIWSWRHNLRQREVYA